MCASIASQTLNYREKCVSKLVARSGAVFEVAVKWCLSLHAFLANLRTKHKFPDFTAQFLNPLVSAHFFSAIYLRSYGSSKPHQSIVMVFNTLAIDWRMQRTTEERQSDSIPYFCSI